MFFCDPYFNIAMECCIDVQVESNFTQLVIHDVDIFGILFILRLWYREGHLRVAIVIRSLSGIEA